MILSPRNSRAFTSRKMRNAYVMNKRDGEELPDPSITRKRFVKAFNDSFVGSARTSDAQSKRTRDSLFFFLDFT